jgi:hypothetical protein
MKKGRAFGGKIYLVIRIEKQFCSEIHTVTKPEQAQELFERLTESVKHGQGMELIIRMV